MKFVQAQEIPTQLGQEFGGGYFCGYYSLNADGVATHALIMAPQSARSVQQLKITNNATANTSSSYDGLANTNAMIAAGASDHPAADYCTSYTGGGFTDWYVPSQNEWHACLRAFRSESGEAENNWNNAYACPQLLANNYKIGKTKQPFFTISVNDYENVNYWTSTETPGVRGGPATSNYRFAQLYANPLASASKSSSYYVLPFRRVAIPTPFLVPPHEDPV